MFSYLFSSNVFLETIWWCMIIKKISTRIYVCKFTYKRICGYLDLSCKTISSRFRLSNYKKENCFSNNRLSLSAKKENCLAVIVLRLRKPMRCVCWLFSCRRLFSIIIFYNGKLAALYGKQGERMLTRIHRDNPQALFINKFTTNPSVLSLPVWS